MRKNLTMAACILLMIIPCQVMAGPAAQTTAGETLAQVKIPNRKLKANIQPIKPADLTVTAFEVTRSGSSVNYTVTFKNIGEGPAGCFDYKLGDSAKGIKMVDVCPPGTTNWVLGPGESVTHSGSVSKNEFWRYPTESGYNSKLYVIVNHGGKVNEDVINNNGSGKKPIFWGLE